MVEPTPNPESSTSRIALAHDWLCGYRGGEGVLERIAHIITRDHHPSRIYTMFDDARPLAPAIDALPRTSSILNRLPLGATRLRRWLLPAYPLAVGSLSRKLAREHRRLPIHLLISTSSAAIKSLQPPPSVPHLCYCHAPARYLWSRADDYAGGLRGVGLAACRPALRNWDRATASRATRFLANSTHTAEQIRACYNRDAEVLFPPVRTDYFTPTHAERDDSWLLASALEPYKRVDLAIQAAAESGAILRIVGDGSIARQLRASAPPNVHFLGRLPDEQLRSLFRTAAVLIHPQIEDFGITAVEAQACGMPVAAFAQGGARDTVRDTITGAYFHEQTPKAIIHAAASASACSPKSCRTHALQFAEHVFDAAIARIIDETLARQDGA